MDVLVSDISGFIKELPDTQLAFHPLFGAQAVDVPGRAVTAAQVPDLQFPSLSLGRGGQVISWWLGGYAAGCMKSR